MDCASHRPPPGLVLHTGVAAVPLPMREHVDDPSRLLTRKRSDRAVALFDSVDEVREAREALTTILRQWIRAMDAHRSCCERETSR